MPRVQPGTSSCPGRQAHRLTSASGAAQGAGWIVAAMNDQATPMPTGALPETPTSMGDERLHDLIARDPDTCPEVIRELVMCRGALDSLSRTVEEFRTSLHHVLRVPGVPREHVPVPNNAPATESALGVYVRGLYDEIGHVERLVQDTAARLAV